MKFNHFIVFIFGLMVCGALWGCAEDHEMDLADWCAYSGGEFEKLHQLCKCGGCKCDRGVFCIKENGAYICADPDNNKLCKQSSP